MSARLLTPGVTIMYPRTPVGWLLAAVLIFPIVAGAQQWAVDNARGSISGTVVLLPEDFPAQRIQIKLLLVGNGLQRTALTNNGGDFGFAGLPQGTYILTVEETGYDTIHETVRIGLGDASGLTLYLKRSGAGAAGQNGSLVSARELGIPPKARKEYEKGQKSKLKEKDPTRSLAHFQRAVAEFPSYYEAYLQMGIAYQQLGQKAEAEKAIRESIELSGESFADADFALSELLDEQERYSDAEKAARQGLLMKPNSWAGQYVLGWALLGSNQLKEAEESAQKALLLNQDFAKAHLLLASIHIRTRNAASLLKDLDAYLALEPNGASSAEINQFRDAVQHNLDVGTRSAFEVLPTKP